MEGEPWLVGWVSGIVEPRSTGFILLKPGVPYPAVVGRGASWSLLDHLPQGKAAGAQDAFPPSYRRNVAAPGRRSSPTPARLMR